MPIKPALRTKAPRGQGTAVPYTLPAPTGGWNARDSLATMPPLDAVELVNWFPGSSEVTLRSGAFLYAYDFSTAPRALMVYKSATTETLFACTDTAIYDVSVTGSVGGGSLYAVSSGYFIAQNITTPGGSFLLAVNGADPTVLWNGAAFSNAAITGLPAVPTNIALMANRIWLAVEGSLSPWYLPLTAIAGAATELPLGTVLTNGGYLMAMGTWTVDGGSGSDDLSVFVSSTGQVAIYSGTDPASSSTWRKVGVYNLAPPLGRKCLFKLGGDLILITRSGLFPLSKALQSASVSSVSAITNKIDTAFILAAEDAADSPGWCGEVFPDKGMLLVNIPTELGQVSTQFVMNTVTNSWCSFQGWNATDLAVFNHKLYFTYDDGVAEALTVDTDFGEYIPASAIQAFNTLGRPNLNKQITLLRPIFTLETDTTVQIGIATDYSVPQSVSDTAITDVIDGGIWDGNTTFWDDALWGGSTGTVAEWMSGWSEPCYAAAIVLRVGSALPKLSWSATTLVYKPGGIL